MSWYNNNLLDIIKVRLHVQSCIGGEVTLSDFEATPEGIIESMTHYSKKSGYDEELEAVWNKDRHFWKI